MHRGGAVVQDRCHSILYQERVQGERKELIVFYEGLNLIFFKAVVSKSIEEMRKLYPDELAEKVRSIDAQRVICFALKSN